MFNTMMSFSSLILIYMALCHHELLPFVDEKSQFYDVLSLNQVILIRTMKLIHNVKYQNVYNIVYIAIFLQELLPFVHEILPLFAMFFSLTHVISNGT